MIDAIKIVRTVLLGRDAITAEVGTRVYGGPLRPSSTLDWATPSDVEKTICIVDGSTGDYMTESPVINADLDLLCLASSEAEATALAGVVYDDLEEAVAIEIPGIAVVMSFTFREGPFLDQDPQTKWHFSRLPVEAMIAE